MARIPTLQGPGSSYTGCWTLVSTPRSAALFSASYASESWATEWQWMRIMRAHAMSANTIHALRGHVCQNIHPPRVEGGDQLIEVNQALQWAQHGPVLFLWARAGATFVAISFGQRTPSPAAGTPKLSRLWPCLEKYELVGCKDRKTKAPKDQEGRRHPEISRICDQLTMRSMPSQTTKLRRLRWLNTVDTGMVEHCDVWGFFWPSLSIQRLRWNIQNGHVRLDPLHCNLKIPVPERWLSKPQGMME